MISYASRPSSEPRDIGAVLVLARVGHSRSLSCRATRWGSHNDRLGLRAPAGRMEWQPPARWRVFRPLLAPILAWNARRSFRRMAQVLQRATV